MKKSVWLLIIGAAVIIAAYFVKGYEVKQDLTDEDLSDEDPGDDTGEEPEPGEDRLIPLTPDKDEKASTATD